MEYILQKIRNKGLGSNLLYPQSARCSRLDPKLLKQLSSQWMLIVTNVGDKGFRDEIASFHPKKRGTSKKIWAQPSRL